MHEGFSQITTSKTNRKACSQLSQLCLSSNFSGTMIVDRCVCRAINSMLVEKKSSSKLVDSQ